MRSIPINLNGPIALKFAIERRHALYDAHAYLGKTARGYELTGQTDKADYLYDIGESVGGYLDALTRVMQTFSENELLNDTRRIAAIHRDALNMLWYEHDVNISTGNGTYRVPLCRAIEIADTF